MLPEIFTVAEVASHLGLSREIVEREARLHGCCSIVHRHLMFTTVQVERLIMCREVPASPQSPAPSAVRSVDGFLPSRPFTTQALARLWSVTPQHVRDLAAKGELKHFRVGRLIRISAGAVEEYEAERERLGKVAEGGDGPSPPRPRPFVKGPRHP